MNFSLQTSDNLFCADDCKSYEFFGDETSPATEWSLVCDKLYLGAFMNSIYFAGSTMGGLGFSALAKNLGFKKILFLCLYVQGVVGAGTYFAYSFELFIVMVFAQGFFVEVSCMQFMNAFVLVHSNLL